MSPRRPAAIALTALLAACGTAGDRAAPPPPAPPPPAEPVARTVATAPGFLRPVEESPRPVRLRIPRIGVDVDVLAVGVDGDGDMQVPAADVAGWYRFGPRPGEPGSSVLAAHVDDDGRRGAFFRLRDLRPGDPVEVTAADGGLVRMAVREVTRVAKGDLAETGAFDRSGRPRVALVTCGGDFDPERRSYEDNVVAVAEPVDR